MLISTTSTPVVASLRTSSRCGKSVVVQAHKTPRVEAEDTPSRAIIAVDAVGDEQSSFPPAVTQKEAGLQGPSTVGASNST